MLRKTCEGRQLAEREKKIEEIFTQRKNKTELLVLHSSSLRRSLSGDFRFWSERGDREADFRAGDLDSDPDLDRRAGDRDWDRWAGDGDRDRRTGDRVPDLERLLRKKVEF